MFSRFDIITEDRIGITLEILNCLYTEEIDLITTEVFSKKVSIKINEIQQSKKDSLIKSVMRIKDVTLVRETDLLEYEKNERKLLAVIDSLDEGIMVVNKEHKIEIFNKYCEELFRYSKEEVIGTDIIDLITVNPPILKLLKDGKDYDNIELKLKNERGEIHYITTGRAVKNDLNKTVGAVATIKDINKAIKLANVVTAIEEGAFSEIVGNSRELERVKNLVSSVAKSNSTVLLRGESGTGKELFAKAINNLSEKKEKKLVTINCAALPDNLIESELFGYEKGSFTGAASSGRVGLFKEADGGTIFLDEIGELSLSLQAKLLRVLQEGTIRKVGSNKEEKIDVRVIAATNRALEKMVQEGSFREDLYYRLNVIPIYIPPLRNRMDDISALVSHFIEKLNNKLNKKIKGANFEFISGLLRHNWPGNVRELQNVMERAMNICNKNILTPEDLLLNFHSDINIPISIMNSFEPRKLCEAVEICEKENILYALEKHKSIRKAAKALGVSHTTVMNKINKYKIDWN